MASLPSEPGLKKQKLSKREKKRMMSEKGKKSAPARGKGICSREEFTLPTQWECETREGETRLIVDCYSPGKTKYHSASEVEKVLRERGMHLCFNDDENQPEQVSSSESDGYHSSEFDRTENTSLPSKVLMKWNSICVSANQHRSVSLLKTSTKVLNVLRRNVMICYDSALFFLL